MIQTLLRIRDKHGHTSPLIANRAQHEYARRQGTRNIVLKARQMGVSTFIAAQFFVGTITRPGTLTVQVAHDQKAAEEIFRIVHRFLANLPKRLRTGALETSRANVRQLVFPKLDSEYRVETAGDASAGRGLTIQNLHCSEVARWPGDAASTLASLRAAVPPGGEIVLESTPNGAGGCFYDEWMRAPQTGYVQHFFPWWWQAEYAVPGVDRLEFTEEEHSLARRHGLTTEQVAFRRELRANLRGLAIQEFAEDPVSCFLASGECVFDLAVVEKRLSETRGDRDVVGSRAAEVRDNGRLHIWWPPRAGGEYILGVDPAGGGSNGDFACAEVIERVSGLQCAELHGHFPPSVLATRVAALGREYNHACIAVERNNHGHGVLAHLSASEQYPWLYEHGNQAGWLTTAASRPRMIEEFAAVLANQPQLFSSPRLMTECRTFIRRADGSPAAAQGAHDDCVMAMSIALAVRADLAGRRRWEARQV
ncbi:MAG: terminase [Candidatus Korobacteraceae bacterium]